MDNIVHFLDANYVPITQPIDTYSSLTYTPKWDEYGEFKFVSKPSLFASIKLAKRVMVNGKTFLLDNIKTKDASANDEMSVSGRSLEALLDKVVNPAPIRIRGNMEVQIRAVVTSLAITGLQAVTKLALGTLHGYQNSIDIVVPRGSLGLWLYTTLNQRGFSYTIEYDQASDSVLFDIVQEVDRSNDQEVNEPVIFSSQKGNIENVEYSKSDTDACNLAIVYDDETGEVVYVDESNGEEKRALIVQGKSANTADDDSLYFAKGSDARSIYTSSDGLTFTLRYTFPADITIESIAYGAGMFMACGYNTSNVGIVAISYDAVSWVTSYTNVSLRLQRMAYNDGVFVITGSAGNNPDFYAATILSSYDGYTFSSTYLNGDTVNGSASYEDGMWFVCARNYTTNDIIVYRSTYGFVWERKAFTAPAFDPPSGITPRTQMHKVVKSGGSLFAVGFFDPAGSSNAGDLIVAESADLFDTCEIMTFPSIVNPGALKGAASDGARIVVSGDYGIVYSTDGFATASGILYDVTYNGSSVTYNGIFTVYRYDASTGDVSRVYTSDMVTWSNSLVPTLPDYSRIVVYGSSTQVMSMGDIGRAALAEARAVEVIDGDILPNVAPIIGTDCNVGDITSVVDINRGIIATKRLVAAQTVIEGRKHYTIPKFGTDYLSLTKYIKKEIAKNV